MYFSKVKLTHSTHARTELVRLARNGAYSAHQLLWRLFSSDSQRSFLFREETEANGLPAFYVLSMEAPQADASIFSVAAKPYHPQLRRGDRLAYKIRVNPTISVKEGEGKSRRHDVLMHAKRQAQLRGLSKPEAIEPVMFEAAQRWFADENRLERWGFKIDSLPDVESYTKHKIAGRGGKSVQFSCADLQGTLTVEEPESFINTVATGLGRAKAFGCGLLLIRRI